MTDGTMPSTSKPGQHRLRFSAEHGVAGAPENRVIRLRPGLVVVIYQTDGRSRLKTDFDVDTGLVHFGFTWRGRYRCSYRTGAFRSLSHSMEAGSNGIFHLPKTSGLIERPKDQAVCVVAVLTTPKFLRSHLVDELHRMPGRFRAILDEERHDSMAWFGTASPLKTVAVSRILHCPWPTEFRLLFLESCVLDLIATQLLEFVAAGKGAGTAQPLLSTGEIERIHAARARLVSDFEFPPKLPELARAVGISDKKLKAGFRQVFGTSVFGYFREYRLQAAREMLETGDANVSETAFAVGYQSLSHFSQAFRRRFGVNPKDYLADRRRARHFSRKIESQPNTS